MIHTLGTSQKQTRDTMVVEFAPLILLPIFAYFLFYRAPAWQLMWMLAMAIYFGWKWQTLVALRSEHPHSKAMACGYLLLWPGMNAATFLDSQVQMPKPTGHEWLLAISKLAIGLLLLFVVVPQMASQNPLVVGWLGMIGLVFTLHFGLFHILSLGWRQAGVHAEPLMNFPLRATSLSDFWGRRWNSAFRDLAFGQIFRPVARQIGIANATLVVFLVSGLIHDLVISVPVQGGWGGPTFYFVVQGFGLLAERSRWGKIMGLGRGLTGRLFCGICIVGPIGLLFHGPFVRHAILPTLAALGVVRS